MKICRKASPKYYQKAKRRFKKSPLKDIKILLKKKKIKSNNKTANDIRISRKMKNKGWLSIEKNIMKCKKITVKSLNKVLLSIYQSKNVTILG